MAGQNVGGARPPPETNAATAFDLKAAHRLLKGLTDADLEQISILPSRSRLEQGATYVDLHASRRHEFTARRDQTIEQFKRAHLTRKAR